MRRRSRSLFAPTRLQAGAGLVFRRPPRGDQRAPMTDARRVGPTGLRPRPRPGPRARTFGLAEASPADDYLALEERLLDAYDALLPWFFGGDRPRTTTSVRRLAENFRSAFAVVGACAAYRSNSGGPSSPGSTRSAGRTRGGTMDIISSSTTATFAPRRGGGPRHVNLPQRRRRPASMLRSRRRRRCGGRRRPRPPRSARWWSGPAARSRRPVLHAAVVVTTASKTSSAPARGGAFIHGSVLQRDARGVARGRARRAVGRVRRPHRGRQPSPRARRASSVLSESRAYHDAGAPTHRARDVRRLDLLTTATSGATPGRCSTSRRRARRRPGPAAPATFAAGCVASSSKRPRGSRDAPLDSCARPRLAPLHGRPAR